MMTVAIRMLTPGSRFRLPELLITGRVVRVSSGYCLVKLDGNAREVDFTDREGNARHFVSAGRPVEWSAGTMVEPLESEVPGRQSDGVGPDAATAGAPTEADPSALPSSESKEEQ